MIQDFKIKAMFLANISLMVCSAHAVAELQLGLMILGPSQMNPHSMDIKVTIWPVVPGNSFYIALLLVSFQQLVVSKIITFILEHFSF